jgi:hypothetical protein
MTALAAPKFAAQNRLEGFALYAEPKTAVELLANLLLMSVLAIRSSASGERPIRTARSTATA